MIVGFAFWMLICFSPCEKGDRFPWDGWHSSHGKHAKLWVALSSAPSTVPFRDISVTPFLELLISLICTSRWARMDRRSIWSIWSICQDSSECARDVAWTSRHLSADIALYGSVGKARFWNHQPLSDHNLSVCRAAQRRHGPPSKLYTASCPLNLSSHITSVPTSRKGRTGRTQPHMVLARRSHCLVDFLIFLLV